MAFDQAPIVAVDASQSRGQLHLSWTSTAPGGSWYQVYVGRKLSWSGISTTATVPAPPHRANVDVGVVGATERAVDFSASLPAPPSDRVTLAWQGGTFQDDGIAGFRIYADGYGSGGFGEGGFGSDDPPLATVPAYTPGVYTDGFGSGGFGDGGFGAAAGSYSWTSGSLTNGDWTFAVVPFDTAGNEGEPAYQSATIAAPPGPPAFNAAGKRLSVSYNPTTHVATLAWLASPE
jgi:hypothetical protein